MSYRNGTYVAFDALGETDPTKSDFKYYSIIEGWTANEHIDFSYVNSHDKTFAVKDTSSKTTLINRIRQRLSNSKNVLVILSDQTRNSGSMLSTEIELALDSYKLPLIITYTGYRTIASPAALAKYWPTALSYRISSKSARAIHIPFRKDVVFAAIQQFNLDNLPTSALNYYSEQSHRQWGYLPPGVSFSNHLA